MNLSANLEQLKQLGLYRRRRTVASPQAVHINVDGRWLVNFCSNDYLGLANHPEIVKSFKTATDDYGLGSGSAHLICGHNTAHQALEEELAEFTGRERALLFSTGYMANMGAITALVGSGDRILADRLSHASLLDGALLSRAQFKRYLHVDMDDLTVKLGQSMRTTLLVTEGVFSMDGDMAPLPQLAALAKAHQVLLMVDDAHGLGVLGDTGGGALQHYRLSSADIPVLMGTLGKGFGCSGAFIAGCEDLIETLIQKARSYIYTTAMPAAIAEATRTSLKIVYQERWRREKLQALIARFSQGAQQLGLSVMDSATPIQPLLIGDSHQAVAISKALFARGFWVTAIRPPTVPAGQARLRVTLSANHQDHQVDGLLDALESVMVTSL